MRDAELYSIEEARKLLGGSSRNTIYSALRTGGLSSVVFQVRIHTIHSFSALISFQTLVRSRDPPSFARINSLKKNNTN